MLNAIVVSKIEWYKIMWYDQVEWVGIRKFWFEGRAKQRK